MNKNWRTEHNSAIDAFLKHLNANTQTFILKGGTALMKCYGLDRFSEDIDLDGDLKSKDIVSLVDSFCSANGFSYRIAKNTDTVKRFFVNYGNSEKPLKVEVSYRQKELNMKQASIVNGILVYNINALCMLKTNAYAARDKIRDLYDISFICDKYFDSLSETVVDLLRVAVGMKGLENFDYIVREQSDELIDPGKMLDMFLKMHDSLGLLRDTGCSGLNTPLPDETAIKPILDRCRDKISAIQKNTDENEYSEENAKKDIAQYIRSEYGNIVGDGDIGYILGVLDFEYVPSP